MHCGKFELRGKACSTSHTFSERENSISIDYSLILSEKDISSATDIEDFACFSEDLAGLVFQRNNYFALSHP